MRTFIIHSSHSDTALQLMQQQQQ